MRNVPLHWRVFKWSFRVGSPLSILIVAWPQRPVVVAVLVIGTILVVGLTLKEERGLTK